MNHQLAHAIVATFHETEKEAGHHRLARFNYRAWEKTYAWLDASGLALYFLDRVRNLDIEDALPEHVLEHLQKNTADNLQRTDSILKEFIEINREFQAVGISYTNLKGFTLIPEVSSNAALRCQFDLDFCVAYGDLARCEKLLEQRQYAISGANSNVREFIAGGEQIPSIRDLYKEKPQKSVEIHFANPADHDVSLQDRRLSEREWREWNSLKFPILSECERFFELALHLFKHLNGEWTRASWILEYSSFINYHRDNEGLWLKVQEQMFNNAESKMAVGAVTLLANKSFDVLCLPEVLEHAVADLPAVIRLWIERYGDRVLFAQFPGTKLYLLLQRAIAPSQALFLLSKLLPLHRPRQVVVMTKNHTFHLRRKQTQNEIRYFFFRLRFHLVEGLHYAVESLRWKKTIASLQV